MTSRLLDATVAKLANVSGYGQEMVVVALGYEQLHPRVCKLRMPHAIAVAGRPTDVQRRRQIQLHRGLEPQ